MPTTTTAPAVTWERRTSPTGSWHAATDAAGVYLGGVEYDGRGYRATLAGGRLVGGFGTPSDAKAALEARVSA